MFFVLFPPLRTLLPSPLLFRPVLPKPAPLGRPELPLRVAMPVGPLRLFALFCRPNGLRGVPAVVAPLPPLFVLWLLLAFPLPVRLEGPLVVREESAVAVVAVFVAAADESTMVASGLRGGAGFRGLGNAFAPPLLLPPPAPLVTPLLVALLPALLLLLALLPDFSFDRCTLSVRVLRGLPEGGWWLVLL